MTDSNVDMSQQTLVRSYRPGDEEAIIEVLVEVFGGWPSFDLDCQSVDHWRWRYLSQPGNAAHLAVVEAGGRIVGCLHHSPLEMKISDSVYPGMLSGDFAVLEAFRGEGLTARFSKKERGLRKKTGEMFSVFETPNPRVIRRYSRLAHTLPYQSRHLLRVRRISEHLVRKHHPWRWIKAPVYKVVQSAQRIVFRSRRCNAESKVRISEIGAFDQRFDHFWEKISQYYGLIVKRDREYLEWRYGDRRGGRFRVFCAEDSEGVAGFVVLRVNTRDPAYPVGFIVDLLCLPGREEVAARLLQKSLAYFDAKEVNAINCLVPRGHPYFKLYLANGFVDTLERNSVFVSQTGPLEEQLAAATKLPAGRTFYAYGDIDTI